ncbi:probable E3 ubiquitin-protein ligase MID2 [Mizuhopecten yessoensis]|uniref:E3 ubiquitin-protein ligase TRIM56 n=1 Tax=Mizuhopecten yessoensis TaxID=6573 RepID=A0A210PH35_MIZYE|nr:probable E3 ubiquitin-protein ligase MID2 [Mizuhopecten yessoensis]XP_021341814.1 probable E3 ubiquitin-protein ligase MID2 [Mizuhopecten yessoensis]XP_021341815.1 probable E3 ubiquitin-protein ligase MID2 [Mizuhopecten yessoensis]OWF35803.1 E3 ubiquitin-protein ligase TRIM56 [Mizuhopecten yessoensis]
MAEANPDPEYKCLMCMKPYNEPRELPCGHTFCYQCLTSYIDKEHVTADEDRHYFPCPVCDTPISPRDVSLNVRNWATSFPINNLFLSSTAQRSNDRVCGACLRDNETSAGEAWCADCAEILCKQCRAVHGRIKVTAKHRLVPVGENVGGFYDMMVNGVCSNHDEKPLEIYCLDHTAMCCSVCVSLSHRSCNHVKSLRDVIEKTMTDRSSHETEWEDITDESKKMLDEEDAGFTFLVSKEKAVSAEMTNRIQQAKDKLDDLNTTFQSDLAEKCNEHRKQLSPRRNHVNTFHINAENSNMLMTRLEKQCSDRDRFIMREKTKNQISAHYRRLDQNTKNQPSRFEITLKLGTIIDEIMKVTSAGNADVTSTESSISQNANVRIQTLLGALLSTPSVTTFANSTSASDIAGSLQHMTVQSAPVTEPVDVWTGSVSCVHSLNASALGGSNSCLLNGGIFTDNGELLMTDCNNSRLLLFDDMYSFQKEYIFDSGKPQ